MDTTTPALVGRTPEREAIARVLKAPRPGIVVSVEGEPGIGKSRLLAHLSSGAQAQGALVLAARATEFEADLPYGLFTEALNDHLAHSRVAVADPGALAATLPALGGAPAPTDRHRTHRALRELLERLAATRPLVLCLDDIHWADPASCGALAALVRRPPAARVLLALAAREGRFPAPVAAALGAALAEGRVARLALVPLTRAEAAELIGDGAETLYADSGGNPFYLEQLARGSGTARAGVAGDDSVPPAVAAALAAELAGLSLAARRLLDAAAVVGDPFEPSLAAEVAELPEPEMLEALDELLAHALVRPGDAPRRFAFRHPVVRHAIYEAAPGGWRLGAHGRAAEVLERRGAGPIERAHHVEHAARPGDEDAIALLERAADELQSLAPATAARFYSAALRLHGDARREAGLRLRLTDALAASGDAEAARAVVLDALSTTGPDERLPLTIALANQEWWLGGHLDARRRLHVLLDEAPAAPSPDRIRLRLALTLTALMAGDLEDAQAHARDARDDARAIRDPVFEAAALAGGALACVAAAQGSEPLDESVAAFERLTPEQLATRLPGLWMHARARRALGRFEAALADLERATAIAADTGRERILLIVTIESVPTLIELGRIADAGTAAEDGVERARLSGHSLMLLWSTSALACARLAAGDVTAALRHAGEAAETGTRADFHAAGQPGWCLGAALTAAGNPDRAVAVLLEAFGGPQLRTLLPADRPAAAADLAVAHLAGGDAAAAQAALAQAPVTTPWAASVTGIAEAAILLARDRPADAIAAARSARHAGAPLASARARLVEGRALAASGDRAAAVELLTRAESAFHGFGAARLRSEAVRELRRLGHRVVRASGGDPSALTAREREIAELVADGRTNQEIAAQLVLSPRTIEAHLRNTFAKLGVRSRVELARDLQSHRA